MILELSVITRDRDRECARRDSYLPSSSASELSVILAATTASLVEKSEHEKAPIPFPGGRGSGLVAGAGELSRRR